MPRRSRWLLVLGACTALVATIAPVAAQNGTAANDPVYEQGLQWGLDAVGAPAAWATARGADTTIAVIDSGIDLQHEDLAPKIVGHVSCIGAAGDPAKCRGSGQDDNGHGTHVAGIAAAVTGNGRGIAGVAPDAKLLAVRVLANDCNGETCTASGTAGDVAAGIRWAVDNGADVINLSLGGGSNLGILTGCAFCDAINYAWGKGVVAVIAAGNDSMLPSGFGDEPAVIVTATTKDDGRASYSASSSGILRSARWPVAAPGGEGETNPADCATGGSPKGVLSTYWIAGHANEYACLAGTSMAAPFVSGAVALLRSQGLSPQQAVDRLLTTARDLGGPGRDSFYGEGRIDVATAVGPPGTVAPSTTATTPVTSGAAVTVAEAPATLAPAPETSTEPTATVPTAGEPQEFSVSPVDEQEPSETLVALAVALLMAAAAGTGGAAWSLYRRD
ncbi:MAG: S8 family serine peptidase [Actinomycetota bacterium]|nr:S8 family serine peptidase [Actinomycetota bacterium]